MPSQTTASPDADTTSASPRSVPKDAASDRLIVETLDELNLASIVHDHRDGGDEIVLEGGPQFGNVALGSLAPPAGDEDPWTLKGTVNQAFVTGDVAFAIDGNGQPTGNVSLDGVAALGGVSLASISSTVTDWDPVEPFEIPSVDFDGRVLALGSSLTVQPEPGAAQATTVAEDGSTTIDLSNVADLPAGLAALFASDSFFVGDEPGVGAGPGGSIGAALANSVIEAIAALFSPEPTPDLASFSVFADLAELGNPVIVDRDSKKTLLFGPGDYPSDASEPESITIAARAVAAALAGFVGVVNGPVADPSADQVVPAQPGQPVDGPAAGPGAGTAGVGAEGATGSAAAHAGAAGADIGPVGGDVAGDVPAGDVSDADALAVEGEGGAPPAPEPIELIIPEAPSEPLGEQASSLRRAGARAGSAGERAADMPTAQESVAEGRDEVSIPEAETLGRAEQTLVDVLGEQPEPSPEIVELCANMREMIESRRPLDEDELLDADLREPAREAGGELNQSVTEQSDAVRENYAGVNEPPVGAEPRAPAAAPETAASIGQPNLQAAEAAPREIPAEDLSLSADRAQLDQRVEESTIHRPTTEVIPDGPFAAVRDGQAEFESLEQTGPAAVAQQQQQAIAQSQEQMQALQLQAVAALNRHRSGAAKSTDTQRSGVTTSEADTRQRLATEARGIFTQAHTDVNDLLRPVTQNAMATWNAEVTRLTTEFRSTLDPVKAWIDERHSGVGGAVLSVVDRVVGLPRIVTITYERAEGDFTDGVCESLIEISTTVNGVIAAAEAIIASARDRITALFTTDIDEGLEDWAAQQLAGFDQELTELSNSVQETRTSFVADISREAVTAVQAVQAEVEQLRTEAGGILGQIVDAIAEFVEDPVLAIINGLLRVVGIPPAAFWALVDKISNVISDIADDPIRFINNLMAAVKLGFELFFTNFDTHVLAGFWEWLFSGIEGGVAMPEDFSPASLGAFALELMGLSWENIRKILVEHIGEENVELIEKAWELVSIFILEGFPGILRFIEDEFGPEAILDAILDAAIDYLMKTLVVAVAEKIVSMLNPAGIIYQAIRLIYDILKWIFNNAARVFRFVETIVNGIADIFAGNISGMAKAVEAALASLIPVVIDLLAELIRLGGLPNAVAGVIGDLRTLVLSAVDAAIGFLVERGRALLESLGLTPDEEDSEDDDGSDDTELGLVTRFRAGDESHRQWIDIVGGDAVLMVASTPQPLQEKLDAWDARLASDSSALTDETKARAPGLLQTARVLLSDADADADAIAAAYANLAASDQEGLDPPSDNTVEAKQRSLEPVLDRLFTVFGERVSLAVKFANQVAAMHPVAQVDITRAFALVEESDSIPGTWDEVKNAVSLRGRFADALTTPTRLGARGFAAEGHKYAVQAIREVSMETGSWPVVKGDKASAADWLNGRKSNIRQGAGGDWGVIVSVLHTTIWTGADPVAALKPPLRAIMGASDARDQDLVNALSGGSILDFLHALAAGGLEKVTAANFKESLWWKGANRDLLKNRFRAISPGMHEWIPTNLIPDVVARASTRPEDALGEWPGWVALHHMMRTDTTWIIFSPTGMQGSTKSISVNGVDRVALTGHAGALCYQKSDGKRGSLTTGQEAWHNRLRDAFDTLESPAQAVGAMRRIAETTLWGGGESVSFVGPYFIARNDASWAIGGTGGHNDLSAEQAERLGGLMSQFDRWQRAVAG